MGARFIGWGVARTRRVVTNDELVPHARHDRRVDRLSARASASAASVARRAVSGRASPAGAPLEDAGIEAKDIDFLILATTDPRSG